MPDVMHWLGMRRIDRFVSMSDMKYDALVSQGIEIVERVPIPDELVPADAQVEIEAKKAAGYYTPRAATRRSGQPGRPFARKVLRARPCPCRSGDVSRLVVAERRGGARARASDAGDRPGRQAAAFPHRSRPPRRRRSTSCSRRRARPIRRSTCRSIRAGGISSSTATIAGLRSPSRPAGAIAAARARAAFDLAIVSVLLDAGAGPAWRYRDPQTGAAIGRSEGLALASLAMFARRRVLRRSAPSRCAPMPTRCANLTVADLARGFQVTDDNPLVGPRRPRRAAAPARAELVAVEAGHIRAATTRRGPAACSTIWRRWPTAASCPRRRSCRSCCSISGRSGRRG